MSTDKIYRIIGLFLLLVSVVLFFISDLSKTESALLGFALGVGYVLINSGENAFDFWKSILRSEAI